MIYFSGFENGSTDIMFIYINKYVYINMFEWALGVGVGQGGLVLQLMGSQSQTRLSN